MLGNNSIMLEYKSICDDQVFAQLTDLFGDTVPTEIILKTAQDAKWKRKYRCIISKYSLKLWSDWITFWAPKSLVSSNKHLYTSVILHLYSFKLLEKISSHIFWTKVTTHSMQHLENYFLNRNWTDDFQLADFVPVIMPELSLCI